MFLEARAEPAADIDRTDDVLLLHDLAEPQGPPPPAIRMGPPADLAPTAGAVPAAGSVSPVPTPAPVSAQPVPADGGTGVRP
jgi:rod shape-determining protein MreC